MYTFIEINKKLPLIFIFLLSIFLFSCKTETVPQKLTGMDIIAKSRKVIDPEDKLAKVFYLACRKEINPSKIEENLIESFIYSYKNKYILSREIIGTDKISVIKYEYNITSGKINKTVNRETTELQSDIKSKIEFILTTYMDNLFFSLFNVIEKAEIKGEKIIVNGHICYKVECLVKDAGKPGKDKLIYYIGKNDFKVRKVEVLNTIISSIRYRKYSNALIPYKYIVSDKISGRDRVTLSRFFFKAREDKEE